MQFQTFSSAVDLQFWYTLASKKLKEYKLSNDAVPMFGYYDVGSPVEGNASVCRLNGSFEKKTFLAEGRMFVMNSIEEFKAADKMEMLKREALYLLKRIEKREILERPSELIAMMLLCYCDLKKYVFYYWFAFPCFVVDVELVERKFVGEVYAKGEGQTLWNEVQEYIQNAPLEQKGFFCIVNGKARPLKEFEEGCTFVMVDPSGILDTPSWSLRNFLTLIRSLVVSLEIQVLGVRKNWLQCILLKVNVSEIQKEPNVVGWERRADGKLAPRSVDLSHSMNPVQLAENAVDLNLNLMKWRLSPELPLNLIQSQRCLLLGAGTLGCNVARVLMGWGIRSITFVDNGRVSYSNPSRQSLFIFEDCVDGGKWKAEAAAENLKRIFPGMKSKGIVLSVPMPGHHIEREQAIRDIHQLENLFEEHDTIFLLMDSRESRWLPTVIGAAKGKRVMNAALGFNSYVCMFHGEGFQGKEYGCYFCNDVVAPTDSLKDRTLDQQCTVTRPGLSFAASGLIVEQFISLVQNSETIPHQIRGFVEPWNTMYIEGQMYPQCTACSKKVLDAYATESYEFLLNVFDDPMHLETLTGLAEMKANADLELESIDSEEFSL